MSSDRIIELYQRRAADYDRDRGRSLQEKKWLDTFSAAAAAGGNILDLGCGMGEPVAAYILGRGFRVTGVDSAPAMIEMCRTRFPDHEWLVADMRQLELGRRFDGILAWDSFFHLKADDQRAMFQRFALHALPRAPLLFTSGPSEGEAIGSCYGEPLYHASLDAAEYISMLESSGFVLQAHVVADPECGDHTIWLATYGRDAAQLSDMR